MRAFGALLVIPILFVACESGGGSSARGGTNTSALPPVPEAPSSRGDRRLILNQRQTAELLILVNEGHSGRRTPEGKKAIALGLDDQGYKVFSDEELDALIEKLDEVGFSTYCGPFQAGEEGYLTRDGGDADFRGIVYLEEAGVRRRLVGLLARGDPQMTEKLRAYSQAKTLIAIWYARKSVSEFPAF